ncbi:hypothetical protein EDD21DRAFT_378515 [Dissophora ornata]|nr:Protein tpx2 [Dissophora ornata]KAI8599925.1 hypothetical protein EDD21DRAFT_378515 [Dissophora ornata]
MELPSDQSSVLTHSRMTPTPTPHESRILQEGPQRSGYKANKVDRRVFESSGDLGVPKVTKLPLTVPKSPSFTKRRHAPLRPAVMPNKAPSHQSQQQQKQQYQKKPQTRITQQGLISSAESARRLSQEKLKLPVRQGSVTAQRIPSRPKVTKPTLTVPQPFKLATEARSERYQEQFRHKLDKWKQIEKENRFKALPLPVYPEKFMPKKSAKLVTSTKPIHLRTDQRAHEREVYEREKQRKEKMIQDMMAEKARENELREQQELRELRQRLVPHPTPIRDYPRIEIHKSARPLTVPRSPVIGDKRKRQMTLERELSSVEEDHSQPSQDQYEHQQQQHEQHESVDPHQLQQDRVRAEIEEQREKDAGQKEPENKRRRTSAKDPADPTIFIHMGRKSWLEYNDL